MIIAITQPAELVRKMKAAWPDTPGMLLVLLDHVHTIPDTRGFFWGDGRAWEDNSQELGFWLDDCRRCKTAVDLWDFLAEHDVLPVDIPLESQVLGRRQPSVKPLIAHMDSITDHDDE